MEKSHAIPLGENVEVLWLRWANDNRLLFGVFGISLTKNQRRIKGFGARTFAINRDGSNSIMLFDGERRILSRNLFSSSVADFLPNEPTKVLIPLWSGSRMNLFKVDINTGAFQKVASGRSDTIRWVADHNGFPRIRIDSNRRGTVLHFYRYSDEDQDWVKYKSIKINDDKFLQYWPIAPGPTVGQYFVKAAPEGEDRVSIYLYDLNRNAYLKKIYAHPEVDIESALISPVSHQVIGATFYVDRLGLMSKDPEIQSQFDFLDAHFGHELNVSFVETNRDGTRSLIYASGPKLPGHYFIFDAVSRQVFELQNRWPALQREELGAMEVMPYKARDGLDLVAYVTHPPGGDRRSAPLIVMPHGGPEQRDFYQYDPLVQFLASRGYRVLQPNFRGSAGYGKSFAALGYRQWGLKMQDDVEDAVQVLLNRNLAFSDNICIAGASYGGYVALMSAQRDNGLYKCAVSIAGVSDLRDQMSYVRREEGYDSMAYQYWLKSIGDPRREEAYLDSISPARNVASITVPILLIHGELDMTVPSKQSEKMNRALEKSGKSVQYIELEGEGHNISKRRSHRIMFEALEEFFSEHLVGEYDAFH